MTFDLFTPPAWHEGPFGSLDFEATDVDPWTARPVSFAYAIVDATGKLEAFVSEIVNCGVPSAPEAVAVHGITEEKRKRGVNPGWAIETIAQSLGNARREKMPVVIMNARFDWPLLLSEAARQHIEIEPVDLLDPGMLDKGVDRYRKGKRKLTDLCQHYGVSLTAAHDATADAVAAAQVTRAIIKKYPMLSRSTLPELQKWQGGVWEEYRRFLCSDGTRRIEKGWPIPERAA